METRKLTKEERLDGAARFRAVAEWCRATEFQFSALWYEKLAGSLERLAIKQAEKMGLRRVEPPAGSATLVDERRPPAPSMSVRMVEPAEVSEAA
jgi:hypothetical protein